MISQLKAAVILLLCFQAVTTASSNCEDGSFTVTTLNVMAIQISSNKEVNVTLNSSMSDQYTLESNSAINITGLCPNVYYSIDFSSVSDSCILIHKIEAISSLSVDAINATAANVTWQKVQGGIYHVHYGNSALQLSEEINLDDSETNSLDYTSATATPLCPQVVYEFNVSLMVPNDQCSDVSAKMPFVNNNEELTGMVSQFSFTNNVNENVLVGSSNRLNVNIGWDAPEIINCLILEYKVTVGQVNYIHPSNTTNVLMVPDLLPNTHYAVVIVPMTIAGSGTSIMKIITTTTDIPWDSPDDFQVQPNGETTVRFTWDPPPIPAAPITTISYKITVTREDGTITLLTYNANIFVVNFGGLNRYEMICGSIAGASYHGTGPSSYTVCGHTSESMPGPVANLTYSIIKAGDIALSWYEPTRPYGIVSYYKVKRYLYHSGSLLQQSTSTKRILQIENLDFDQTYMFEVVAVNGAGDGIKNYIITYRSEETVKLFSNLTAAIVSNTSYEIAWNQANELNSYIFGYELEYYPREITTGYRTTSRVAIQSTNNSKHVITNINPMASYIVTLRAMSSHGVQSSQIVVHAAVLEQPTTHTESDILQLRIYGYMDCDEDNSTVIGVFLDGISSQVEKHCNCNVYITPSVISSISCYANDNINLIRSQIPQNAVGYVLAWLKSPNPFLLINGNIILVDNSETCSYFVSDINAIECIAVSKEESCDLAIVGTFIGTLIPSILIVSIAWLIIILLCTSRSKSDKNNEEKPKKWVPSFQRHRAASQSYENVTNFKGKDKLKLNSPLSTGGVPVITDDNSEDLCTKEVEIKDTKKNIKHNSSKTCLKNPSAGEYMNIGIIKTPNNSRAKSTANVKKEPPTTKPKPKGGKTGDINLNSNEAYKSSTRDERSAIILALQQKL